MGKVESRQIKLSLLYDSSSVYKFCCVILFSQFILNKGSAIDLPGCFPMHLGPPSSALSVTTQTNRM